MSNATGIVYLICFEKPYKHAKHYIGFCEDGNLEQRLKRHKQGNGARLLQVITENKIKFKVTRTWENVTRDFERKLKNRKKSSQLCPLCKGGKTCRKDTNHSITKTENM